MATINQRRRGDGTIRYQATVRRKGYPPRSKTFKHRRDAERWAHGVEVDMERGSYTDRREGEALTVRDGLDRYNREVTSEKKGWREEGSKIEYMRRTAPFARKGIANVTPTDIAAWRDELGHGRKPATVRNYLAVLSGFYQHAMKEWRLVDSNPVRAIRWPSQGRGRDRRLKPGEEARLLEHASPQEVAFITLLIGTGMRFSEALSITTDCLRTGYLHLPETKNGRERDVPLSQHVLDRLEDVMWDADSDGRLFPWTYDGWRHRFLRICQSAGITGLRTHDLRHEGTSRLHEMGLDVFERMAITGHTTIQQSAGYTHLRPEMLKAKMDKAAAQGKA